MLVGADDGDDVAVAATTHGIDVERPDEARSDDGGPQWAPATFATRAGSTRGSALTSTTRRDSAGSVGMTERRNATAFRNPSSTESSASSCSIDSTSS